MNTTPSSDLSASTLPASTLRTSTRPTSALVLGGGGSTGNAWLIGVIAGLFEAGLDVTTADLTIGTSAGSTAAAQLAGATPTELFAATLTPVPPRIGPAGADRGRPSSQPVTDHLERMRTIIAAADGPSDLRRRLGARALAGEEGTDDSWSTRWRSTVASRLPSQAWPQRSVWLTAIDARTGEAVVFSRDSGVELADAVAASCASGRPYRIGDGRFLDGAFRRNENADLATGHGRVLVLSPLGGKSLTPPDWGQQLATQVDELRAGGSTVETIVPGADSEHLFGANAMDLSHRPAAARAGYDQGAALAERLVSFWR